MNRSAHFKGISTGVTDIDGDTIHEGDWLVPSTPKPLTGHEPQRWRDVPIGLIFDYRVIYHDGAFLLKRGGKRGKKRWRLNSLTVRLNGLKISKTMNHTIHIRQRRVGVAHASGEISRVFHVWLRGDISYGMIMAFWKGQVTFEEVQEEAERNWKINFLKSATFPHNSR